MKDNSRRLMKKFNKVMLVMFIGFIVIFAGLFIYTYVFPDKLAAFIETDSVTVLMEHGSVFIFIGLYAIIFVMLVPIWIVASLVSAYQFNKSPDRLGDSYKEYMESSSVERSWRSLAPGERPTRMTPLLLYGWILFVPVFITFWVILFGVIVNDEPVAQIALALLFLAGPVAMIVIGEKRYRDKRAQAIKSIQKDPSIRGTGPMMNAPSVPQGGLNPAVVSAPEPIEPWEYEWIEERTKRRQKLTNRILIGAVMLFVGLLFPPLLLVGLYVIGKNIKNNKNEDEEFYRRYKNEILPVELSKIFTDLHFYNDRSLSSSQISQTKLLPYGETYKSNDYFTAKYKNIQFQQADLSVSKTSTDSDGDTKTISVFSGRWLIMELDKKIAGHFYLWSRDFHTKNDAYAKEMNLQKINLENQLFSEHYSIYASNPHDVFYIFTPHVMEKLNELLWVEEKTKLKQGVGIYYSNSIMHVAISGANEAFELNLHAPSLKKALQSDARLITDLIDVFTVE